MQIACEVARRAQGIAEPNPTVGCVIVADDEIISEGWTQAYGSDHAEVHAIRRVPEKKRHRLANATLYVTLEPCCHHGKTPPCTDAILAAQIPKVVIGTEDPFPEVAGKGIQQLRDAQVDVYVGAAADEATSLIAPYLKLQSTGLPWIIAKWAMTLDGKIATSTRSSQWISSEPSREIVHTIRGRVDGIMVGIGTAMADDPKLTARPAGRRTATRIVVDSEARLPTDSQLARTATEIPVLLAVGPNASSDSISNLEALGVEVLRHASADPNQRLQALLEELGRRRMTNILVEGGEALLGSLFDRRQIDELHVFVAPKLAGGGKSLSPIGGQGIDNMIDALALTNLEWKQVGPDMYIQGRTA